MTTVVDFTFDSASLTMTIWDETQACLSDLESLEKEKGHATALMHEVTRFADASRLTLTLQSEPYGREEGLGELQLISFYEKFGFVAQDDFTTPFMQRNPQ